jgi:rubrerythrin
MSTRQHFHSARAHGHEHLAPEICPSCGSDAGFMFISEQRWPERVAKKLDIAPLVTLWRCLTCDTTVTVNVQ